jgi:hypothetical protein
MRFWHPRITARFSSPLVNQTNLAISGDSHWLRIGRRVARRVKPIGSINGSRPEMEKALEVVRNGGGHGRIVREFSDDVYLALIAIDGTVGSTFDLAALVADYEAICGSACAGCRGRLRARATHRWSSLTSNGVAST